MHKTKRLNAFWCVRSLFFAYSKRMAFSDLRSLLFFCVKNAFFSRKCDPCVLLQCTVTFSSKLKRKPQPPPSPPPSPPTPICPDTTSEYIPTDPLRLLFRTKEELSSFSWGRQSIKGNFFLKLCLINILAVTHECLRSSVYSYSCLVQKDKTHAAAVCIGSRQSMPAHVQ